MVGSVAPMADTLYLLESEFVDPAHPGRRFYCWHCMLLEGLLARFTALAGRLEVRRVSWPRPRAALVSLLGEEHQSLPVLVLGDDTPYERARFHAGQRFIDDMDGILAALAVRHGFPHKHP